MQNPNPTPSSSATTATLVAEPPVRTLDTANLERLLNPATTMALQPLNHSPVPVVPACPAASPTPAPPTHRKSRRTGRVASLPKHLRDMVNRMLWNGVPYRTIVEALDEYGPRLTERNISNWATGGFLEWRAEQEAIRQNRLDQDHLIDHLRRDDAAEIPEVGLQAAATRLSQILVAKTANADDIERNLDGFSRMVDILSRLNREISALQKQRDDAQVSLGCYHNPVRTKDFETQSIAELEHDFSDPDGEAEYGNPPQPPLLLRKDTPVRLQISELQERRQRLKAYAEASEKSPAQNAVPSLPNPAAKIP